MIVPVIDELGLFLELLPANVTCGHFVLVPFEHLLLTLGRESDFLVVILSVDRKPRSCAEGRPANVTFEEVVPVPLELLFFSVDFDSCHLGVVIVLVSLQLFFVVKGLAWVTARALHWLCPRSRSSRHGSDGRTSTSRTSTSRLDRGRRLDGNSRACNGKGLDVVAGVERLLEGRALMPALLVVTRARRRRGKGTRFVILDRSVGLVGLVGLVGWSCWLSGLVGLVEWSC